MNIENDTMTEEEHLAASWAALAADDDETDIEPPNSGCQTRVLNRDEIDELLGFTDRHCEKNMSKTDKEICVIQIADTETPCTMVNDAGMHCSIKEVMLREIGDMATNATRAAALDASIAYLIAMNSELIQHLVGSGVFTIEQAEKYVSPSGRWKFTKSPD